MPARHLVMFARKPVLGQGKTRLARDIGALRALCFYRSCLKRLVTNLHDPEHIAGFQNEKWNMHIALTPDRGMILDLPDDIIIYPQGRGDLGHRMARFLTRSTCLNPQSPVVIIGTDVPHIAPHQIARAFQSLKKNDFVFGPAQDGGYWLIGVQKPLRSFEALQLFKNVAWSTEHALQDTVNNIPDSASVAFLEKMRDIDTGADYKAFLENA